MENAGLEENADMITVNQRTLLSLMIVSLESKIKNSDVDNLAKEVDKKLEAFEKKLQHLVKATEEKDAKIVKLEKRLLNLENHQIEYKKKIKDCETNLKKTDEKVKDKINTI